MSTEKKQQLHAVLFDLDGTLLDTAPEFMTCLNQLLKEEGKSPLSLGHIRHAVSNGVFGLLKLGFKIDKSDNGYNELQDRFLTHYASILGTEAKLFNGVEQLLEQLDVFKIPWGIVTNKAECFTHPLVKKITNFANAKVIISGDTLKYSKPHPAPLQIASQQMNVAPHQVVYIGDAPRDIEAAIAAGMPSIAAAYGYISPNDNPSTWKATLVVNTVADIFPWLKTNLKGF